MNISGIDSMDVDKRWRTLAEARAELDKERAIVKGMVKVAENI